MFSDMISNLSDLMSRHKKKALLILLAGFSFSVKAQQTTVHRMMDSVNTAYHEEAPFLSPDGKTFYFTRAKHPENVGGNKDLGDIWFVTLQPDGLWSSPKSLGKKVNDKNYNAVAGIDQAGSLYIVSFQPEGRKDPTATSLYKVHRAGQGWDKPERVEIRDFLNKTDHQSMSLSADGRILLMAIESYGSYGNEDIYVSFRQSDGSWSAPRSLGGDINTRYQEMTPYLAADNKTLFFASNGYGGMGSRDLFVSERQDDSWRSWSKPVNLGKDVNTNGVELFYIKPSAGNSDFYVSTQNSLGLGDIHQIESPEDFQAIEPVKDSIPVIPVPEVEIEEAAPVAAINDNEVIFSGNIRDAETGELIPAAKVLYKLPSEDSVLQESIAISGTYESKLHANEAYAVTVRAKGYMSRKDSITLSESAGGQQQEKDYQLTPLKVGATIRLKSVHFARGTADLLEASYDELDRVIEIMNENPDMIIELSGHTDNRGMARANIELSEQRVESVKDYMVDKGIKSRRIKGKGYGSSKPIASNLNEEGRKENRRVEFKVLKIK